MDRKYGVQDGYYHCGNCHGTGDEGFSIMPDSTGPCTACAGKGYIYIDPDTKRYSLEELLKK